jgi:hypothetical protein
MVSPPIPPDIAPSDPSGDRGFPTELLARVNLNRGVDAKAHNEPDAGADGARDQVQGLSVGIVGDGHSAIDIGIEACLNDGGTTVT